MATRSEKLGEQLGILEKDLNLEMKVLANENATPKQVLDSINIMTGALQKFQVFWDRFGVQLPEYADEVTNVFVHWQQFLVRMQEVATAEVVNIAKEAEILQNDFVTVARDFETLKNHVDTRIRRDAQVTNYEDDYIKE